MKLTSLAVAALAALTGCSDCDAALTPYCAAGTPCWPTSDGYVTEPDIPDSATEGECSRGTIQCEGAEATCVGAETPGIEQCDGLDNNCDGHTDEDLDLSYYDDRNNCDLCGRCALAEKVCDSGVWTCVPVFGPEPERCNRKDDDCDCEVDEGLEVSYFYPESTYPNTVGRGGCRPGVTRCDEGLTYTVAPTTPEDEQCDGLDNDCDGLTDEGFEDNPHAFLLAVDVSSSMSGRIYALREALCDFAEASESLSLFAVVTFGNESFAPSYVVLVQDFEDAADTCATLQSLIVTGGTEYGLAAVLVESGLEWPYPDRTAVIMTDEPRQDYAPEDYGYVVDACTDRGFTVGVLTDSFYFSDWQPVVDVCGGFTEVLVADRYATAAMLVNKFFGVCLGGTQ